MAVFIHMTMEIITAVVTIVSIGIVAKEDN